VQVRFMLVSYYNPLCLLDRQLYSTDIRFYFLIQQRRFSETRNGELGSEVDDAISPVTSRIFDYARLTPVCEEVTFSYILMMYNELCPG
jgi:hypothetical protein